MRRRRNRSTGFSENSRIDVVRRIWYTLETVNNERGKKMFDNIPTNYHVKLSKIMEPLKLTLLNPEVDVDKVEIRQSDVNRPALQLAGFFEHFDFERLQIVGMVESAYVEMNYEDQYGGERLC